jgi:DNA-binding CsgD family transcriptional regulator/DNA-binding beta-propeller fold protein YncE
VPSMNAARSGATLSKRESEVAQLVSDGHSNREIARRLFISERTAEYHVESIRNKLGFHSRTQIAVWLTEGRTLGNGAVSAPAAVAEPDPIAGSAAPEQLGAIARRRLSRRRLGIASVAVSLLAAILVGLQLLSLSGPPPPEALRLAGTGVRGFSGDGGPATAAQLSQPAGIAVDPGGSVVVVGGDRVRRIGANGVIKTIAGTGTRGFSGDGLAASLAELNLHVFPGPVPDGVAVDQAGNIYLADHDNQRIRLISPSGGISTFAGTGIQGGDGDDGPAAQAQLWNPSGLAVDRSGNLYIADSGNNRIRVIDTAGIIRTVAGTGDPGSGGDGHAALEAQLNGPTGVAIDVAGNLYIADSVNNLIRKVTRGIIETVAGTGESGAAGDGGPALKATLSRPVAIATDDRGELFIADTDNSRVRRIDGAGTITTLAAEAHLDHPLAIAVDRQGLVLVADTSNNRVLRLRP